MQSVFLKYKKYYKIKQKIEKKNVKKNKKHGLFVSDMSVSNAPDNALSEGVSSIKNSSLDL